MISDYKTLKAGYGGFSEDFTVNYATKTLCKDADKKQCDICNLLSVGKGSVSAFSVTNPPNIYRTNEPVQDDRTYQLCKYDDKSWGSCYGKHFCADKYIYHKVDVDGLTVKTIPNIQSLAECYNKIDYVDSTTNAVTGEKGVVYDQTSKMCYTIKDIPNMRPENLTVSWAFNKQRQKPYVNNSAFLVMKKF